MMESGKENPVLNFSDLATRFPEYNETAYQNWVRELYKTTAIYYFIDGGAILTSDRYQEYAESCFKKLKQRYSGNKPAKDYKSLIEENADINFDLFFACMQYENSFFDRDDFENALIQKGVIKADESGDKWCFSPCVMRASLEAEFPDGKKYKYRAKRQVKVGDYIFIERGYKTSGQFGKVTKILEMTATKKSYTAVPQFSFIRKPTQEIIKKNASEIIDINSLERMSKKFDLDTENFAYVDVAVEALLKAASVLAFPDLSTKSAIKKATSFIHEKKTVPAFLFGDSIEKGVARYSYFYVIEPDCYGPTITNFAHEYQIVYTGFYPDWEKSFFAMPIWSKIRQLGNEVAKATCTKEGLDSFFEEYPSEDEDSFYFPAIGRIYDNSVYGCMNKAFEDLVNGDEEYHKACNELIFRSALSILIKGNLANLLDAFLSAEPPIEDFLKELKDYSKECGSSECSEILNKYFK